MPRSRFRLMVAALAVFSLVATACFQIIAFKLSKSALSLGEKGQIVVDLGRVASSLDSTGYVFLLIGVDSTLDLNGVSKFDVQRNFGGKFNAVSHNALRDFLLTGANCSAGGMSASDVESAFDTWSAFRTTVKVNSAAGALGDTNRVKAKVQRNGGSSSSFGDYIIFAGTWTDGNNDLAPGGGELACTSIIGGEIPYRP
ncbi:MAG: hypothetical protein WEE36_03425 [Acidimicrobiia bacterium]